MLQFGTKSNGISYKNREGSYGIAISGEKIGLIELPDNYFTLPGGGIDKGEDQVKALQREVLEETGFECKVGEKITSACQYITIFERELYLNKICHFYSIELIEKIREETEADHEFGWFDLEKRYELLFEKSQLYAVNLYLKKIGSF